MSTQVLLIDDETVMRESITQWLDLADFSVASFADGQDALQQITVDFGGVVITDLKMPGTSGLDMLDAIMAIDKDIPVVLITGHGDVNSAVEAMQKGAYDFIEKPFEPDRLLSTVRRAAEKRCLVSQNRLLRLAANTGRLIEERLIGDCAAMRRIRHDIKQFAAVDVNVLLVGETGTGKEVIARCLHDFSHRSDRSFKAIDCGAIADNRLAETLFGSADQTVQAGAIESADGGSLLLDEISNMPAQQQVALLRVLEQREVLRLGDSSPRTVNLRLISAADVSILSAINDDSFRKDLYFRLNTLEILLPPLRERDDDSVLLFDYFCRKACQLYDRELPPIRSQDITAIRSHSWPGNVRELKNVAERFVLYQTEPVDQLIAPKSMEKQPRSLAQQTQAFEKSVITYALDHCKGNIADTACYLRIPRRTLSDKLQRYDIRWNGPST